MITLPSDVQWVTDDIGVFVVEGDLPGDLGMRTRQRMYEGGVPVGMFDKVHQITDPPGRVAPAAWAQYDKRCETCDGDAAIEQWTDEDHFTEPDCPDCRDGRQVWEVRWPCDGSHQCPSPLHMLGCFRSTLNDPDETPTFRATIEVLPALGGRDFVVFVRRVPDAQISVND